MYFVPSTTVSPSTDEAKEKSQNPHGYEATSPAHATSILVRKYLKPRKPSAIPFGQTFKLRSMLILSRGFVYCITCSCVNRAAFADFAFRFNHTATIRMWFMLQTKYETEFRMRRVF